MFRYRGKMALVTGASMGIGRVFAKELAARGMSVILASRSVESMRSLAEEVRTKHGVRAEVIPCDLSKHGAAAELAAEAARRGLSVDLLVNNAGFLTHGHFETIPARREHDEIIVNVAALVDLTHAFLPPMLERHEGGVINVASIAGFQPIPFMAVYAATKAFVISFSVALEEECLLRNVRVLTLCPGTTDTALFDEAPEAALGRKRRPEDVVATALRALEQGRSIAVDGTLNGLLSHGPRFIPRWLAARFAGRAVQPAKS
ncbi:MAG TPA: SDR family oxidoreductase [Pirellulales bacterium]